MGYLLDYVFSVLDVSPHLMIMDHEHELLSYELKLVSGIVFGLMLLASVYRKYFKKKTQVTVMEKTQEYTVEGMSCNHCKNNVENALKELPGVDSAVVNLADKKAVVSGDVDKKAVIDAIEKVGYKVVE